MDQKKQQTLFELNFPSEIPLEDIPGSVDNMAKKAFFLLCDKVMSTPWAKAQLITRWADIEERDYQAFEL